MKRLRAWPVFAAFTLLCLALGDIDAGVGRDLRLGARRAWAAQEGYPGVWPSGDVTFTVPFRRGNDTDIFMRLMQQPFAAATGKTLTPRHIPGRAGTDAWARMVDDPPTGAVLTGVNYPHVILRALQPDSGVYPEDMAVCAIFNHTPCVLWAAKNGPLTTLDAYMDAAQKAGGTLVVAGPGRFSAGHAAARILDRAMGVHTVYMPYAGTGEAADAVRRGDAAAFWAHTVKAASFGDDFVPLAVAAEARTAALPGAPTFAEHGINMALGTFRGIAVPSSTPEETRKAIAETFAAITATKTFQDAALAAGFTPMPIPYEQIPAFLQGQAAFFHSFYENFGLGNE